MFSTITARRLLACATVTGALCAVAPGTASAGGLSLGSTLNKTLATTLTAVTGTVNGVASTATGLITLPNGTTCQDAYAVTTPFAPWSDLNSYRLVPGGSFSTSGTDWTLGGRASIQPGTSPYQLSGAPSNGELVVPAGGSAVSPYSCVDATQPTVRFMDAATGNALLTVSAVFEVSPGVTVSDVLGVVAPGGRWQPSPSLSSGQGLGGLLSGETTVPMALRFTASGGTVTVDDAFVDPRMCH
jgi:hypothetical protein